MKKIIWDESFSVGLKELDVQHQELIRMVNKLIDMVNVKASSEMIYDTLMKMTEYASEHFDSEEKLMSEYNYPDLKKHKELHAEFKAKTLSFFIDTMEYKEVIQNEVLSYLKEWLTNHILKIDMKYKNFFQEKRANLFFDI